MIKTRKTRDRKVAQFIQKRDGFLHALRILEAGLMEEIVPFKKGAIVLFNKLKGREILKFSGVVTGMTMTTSVTDVFVTVYVGSHSVADLPTPRITIKVPLSDIVAVVTKEASVLEPPPKKLRIKLKR